MAKQLNIGLWAWDGTRNPTDDVEHRVKELEVAVKTALEDLAPGVATPAGGPHVVLHVFVAPEYLFRKNRQKCIKAKAVTAYTEPEKNYVHRELTRISRSHKNFLLVAGSIFWQKTPSRSLLARKKSPEIFNTTYAFHDGKPLISYDKMKDCGELESEISAESKNCKFVAGSKPGVFNCQGLRIGLETCVDHAHGMLKKHGKLLDLQIVTSNTTTYEPPNCIAKPTGYVLHANAMNQAFGNCLYKHPFSRDDKHELTSQGIVSFAKIAIEG